MNEPACIKKLDEAVINRIAAGEVIQRPANALKEMIENSIDAKSTSIQVSVKDGGLKLMQIVDNGTGIRKDDFIILCERFTTSKLEKFEDLNSINTYGFRGEALASISHVAHLSIQSKTSTQDCAYKSSFVDSKIVGSPKPCAGNQGTIITVEDLFYNMTTRKNALKNTTEEFRKISDVVGKYAIHNASISFSLKKFGDHVSIKTPANSNHIDNIRIIYGNSIARELIEFSYTDDSLKFTVNGYMTNVNYSNKKGVFILFINHRLVDSTTIKKSIDQIYSTYLPKNSYPFVYMSLTIDPNNIDVNVHPTKHQVHFLYEEQIVEKIANAMEAKLLKSNNSRTFYTQAKLPGVSTNKIDTSSSKKQGDKNIYDKYLVRTDSTDQKLDKFLCPTSNDGANNQSILNMSTVVTTNKNRKETKLTSVLRLRKLIEENCHQTLRELMLEHVFVGCVNLNQSLVQHRTKLYLCNTRTIAQELFYQLVLYNFENFGTITFSQPLPIKELAMIALEMPEVGWSPEDGDKQELAQQVENILMEKSAMMNDYFCLKIDSKGCLVTIPLLIENYIPEMAGLPKYVLRLASEVNWRKEQECFETFAKETANYYSHREEFNNIENSNWKWTVEHVLYPAVKKYLLPPKKFAENATILQVADLPDLYKVFERC